MAVTVKTVKNDGVVICDTGKHLRLLMNLRVVIELADGRTVVIDFQMGARWDGLSVPWLFRWFLKRYDKKNPTYNISGLVHDFLYATAGCGVFTREECDDIFRGILRAAGKTRFRAGMADIAVDKFGASSWAEDRYNLKSFGELYVDTHSRS